MSSIPKLLRETLRLAQLRRRETSRLLWREILALTPLLLVIVVVLIIVLAAPVGSEQSKPDPKLTASLIPVAIVILLVFLVYFVWFGYFTSKCLSDAMQLGLATVDNDESLLRVKRGGRFYD